MAVVNEDDRCALEVNWPRVQGQCSPHGRSDIPSFETRVLCTDNIPQTTTTTTTTAAAAAAAAALNKAADVATEQAAKASSLQNKQSCCCPNWTTVLQLWKSPAARVSGPPQLSTVPHAELHWTRNECEAARLNVWYFYILYFYEPAGQIAALGAMHAGWWTINEKPLLLFGGMLAQFLKKINNVYSDHSVGFMAEQSFWERSAKSTSKFS